MIKSPRRAWRALLFLAVVASPLRAQFSNLDRERGRSMLREVHDDLKRHYYDTTYRKIELKARVDSADARIRRATSNGEVFGIIAQLLADFDDSHTWFIPPERAARIRFPWELAAVGDSIYVLGLKPAAGLDTLGVHLGDRVVSIQGYEPTRQNLWKIRYLVEVLRPQPALRVKLEHPDGKLADVILPAEIRVDQRRYDANNEEDMRKLFIEWEDASDTRPLLREISVGDVRIWKLESFSIAPQDIDAEMRGVGSSRGLVFDLRGNGGGYVVTLQRLIEHLVDHRVLVMTGRERLERGHFQDDTVWARPIRSPFAGRIVVILDSRSASASEIFARVMQIEARGTVIGDWSAGAVMTSRFYPHLAGTGRIVPYGASITVRDVIMSDGGRLEGRGVMPDEELRPTPADLAAGRDPVLARAVALAGARITAEDAGRLFPIRWRW